MSKADVDTLSSEGLIWRCETCSSTRRKSMRLESQATAGSLNIEDVIRLLSDIREEQAKIVADFNKSHEALYEQLERNTAAITTQTTKVDDVLVKFEEVLQENLRLKKKVGMLEAKIDDQEQYSRRNTIEIHGVPLESPRESQEQVMGHVKKVGAALGFEIKDEMIDACHRLGFKSTSDRPAGIVVMFVRRIDKDKLMQKRREKRDFSTRHIGLADDRPVFLNESLTRAKRVLFAKAREAKKKLDYKFLWQRNGNIFMRKRESDSVITITCQEDLTRLL